jgi:hypothetical protein
VSDSLGVAPSSLLPLLSFDSPSSADVVTVADEEVVPVFVEL